MEGGVHGSGHEVGETFFEEFHDAVEEDGQQVVLLPPVVEVVDGHLGREFLGLDQSDCRFYFAILFLHWIINNQLNYGQLPTHSPPLLPLVLLPLRTRQEEGLGNSSLQKDPPLQQTQGNLGGTFGRTQVCPQLTHHGPEGLEGCREKYLRQRGSPLSNSEDTQI